jgi:IS6 family transposase
MRRSRFCLPVDLGGSAFFGVPVSAGGDPAGGALVPAVRVLSYRDLEELLAERGVEVDHVTLFRWVQRVTPPLVDAARPSRHAVSGR